METKKSNYGIVQTAFGDFWIGTTKLPVKDGCIFDNFDSALGVAKELASYVNVVEMESKDYKIEEICEVAEKFII